LSVLFAQVQPENKRLILVSDQEHIIVVLLIRSNLLLLCSTFNPDSLPSQYEPIIQVLRKVNLDRLPLSNFLVQFFTEWLVRPSKDQSSFLCLDQFGEDTGHCHSAVEEVLVSGQIQQGAGSEWTICRVAPHEHDLIRMEADHLHTLNPPMQFQWEDSPLPLPEHLNRAGPTIILLIPPQQKDSAPVLEAAGTCSCHVHGRQGLPVVGGQ
jgi:hypothetical protein